MAKGLGVGLMGFGTVGQGVYNLLTDGQGGSPFPIHLQRVLVRDAHKERPGIKKELLTTQPQQLLLDPNIGVLVEMMGGLEPAREYILTALRQKKHVVTANKNLLAHHGQELFSTAEKEGVSLLFEASVCAGIPIIKTLTQSLSFYPIQELGGIVNGTTNYILTQMEGEGLSFQEALQKAQDLGYAEADPQADISGEDAACKLAILASIAFHTPIPFHQLTYQGIGDVTYQDLELAQEWGLTIKLLAQAKKYQEGLSLQVGPVLINLRHPLAQIQGVQNAVWLKGPGFMELFFTGPGAGMFPTAYAILSDIHQLQPGEPVRRMTTRLEELSLMEEEEKIFYLRLKGDPPSLSSRLKKELSIQKIQEDGGDLAVITVGHSQSHLQSTIKGFPESVELLALYPVRGGDL